MRMWHILVICVLAGLWFNRGDLGLDRWLQAHGVAIPLQQGSGLRTSLLDKLAEQSGTSTASVATVREVMPHFTARTRDGMDTWSSDQLRGKTSMVVFFAGWCGPCKAEMPTLLALKKTYPDVYFVGIVYEDTAASAMQMLRQYGSPFDTVVMDHDKSAARAVRLTGVPNSFVVDSTGTMRARFNGGLLPEELPHYKQIFQELTAGQW